MPLAHASVLVTCLLAGAPAGARPASASEASRLLDRVVEAFGGRRAVLAAGAVAFESTGARQLDPAGTPMPVSGDTLIVFPDRYRQRLITFAGTATTVLRGPRGMMQVGDVITGMSDEQVAALAEALRLNPLALARRQARGELAASRAPARPGDGEGIARVTLDGGAEVAIERASGRIAAVRYPGTFMGKAGTFEVRYADYRKTAAGIVYPHSAEAEFDGRPAYTSRLTTLTVNPPYTEGYFLTPWVRPQPAGAGDR